MSRRDDKPTAGDGWDPGVETCRIVLWRGYRTSAFYARSTDDPSGESVVEPSASFRARHAARPDAPDARSAHEEVVTRLQEAGWIPTGHGDEWYATEFARPVLVPAERPVAAPPPPAPAPLPEGEPEPALTLARPAPHTPPEARSASAAPDTRPTRRIDRWRVAATTGLVTAIALVGWVATHPSALPRAL